MSSYWEQRAEYRTHIAHKNSDHILQEILVAYDKSIQDINEDIDRIFNRYASKHSLSAEEAKKFLNETISSQEEYLALKSKLSKIKDKTIKKRLKAKLESEAYKSRITRLEALKQNIYANTKVLADKEIVKSATLYGNTVKENYYRNVFDFQQGTGFAYSFTEMSPERVKKILEYNWSGKHYSERVWQNMDVLASKLQETIISGMMSGKSSRRMAEELTSLSMMGKFAAERLVRTEVAYMISASDQVAAEDRGTKNRRFRATLDLVTSEICRAHDGKIVPVKDSVPGKNVPPMHPFCRSFMEEIIDGYEHKVRTVRNPNTGKPIQVPADMTYQEWYNKYVGQKEKSVIHNYSNKVSKEIFELVDEPEKFNDVMQRIDGANFKFDEKFNDSTSYLNAVVFTGDEGYISNYIDMTKSMVIRMSPQWQNAEEAFDKLTKDNTHIKTTDPMSIYAHEYGHFIVDAISLKKVNFKMNQPMDDIMKLGYIQVKNDMVNQIKELYFAPNIKIIKNKISRRAMENINEFIAESFSQYFYGEKCSDLAENVVKYLIDRWR